MFVMVKIEKMKMGFQIDNPEFQTDNMLFHVMRKEALKLIDGACGTFAFYKERVHGMSRVVFLL